jgi:glutamate-1-semialdehyde aminotransferase
MLLDYRSTLPTPEERALMEQFYLGLLGQGIVLTPDLAGCVSTPMLEAQVDQLVDAADRVFGCLEI